MNGETMTATSVSGNGGGRQKKKGGGKKGKMWHRFKVGWGKRPQVTHQTIWGPMIRNVSTQTKKTMKKRRQRSKETKKFRPEQHRLATETPFTTTFN